MRRAALTLLATLACASHATASESTVTKLSQAWGSCVKAAYQPDQLKVSDRRMAAEVAFQACATEEDVLLAYIAGSDYAGRSSAQTALRAHVKRRLLE